MKISVLQFNADMDERGNTARLEGLVLRAADEGAQMVFLPEVAFRRGVGASAEPDAVTGRASAFLAGLARRRGIWIHSGSIPEAAPDSPKPYNTSFLVGPSGEVESVYRKMHLFDVDLPEMVVRESDSYAAGHELVTANAGAWTIGMLICYDLRFGEVWRRLRDRGVNIYALPANFTERTGEAHWEVLLRARAIEFQSYVAAAAQWGPHPGRDFRAYGRSMIIDPWGTVLARAGAEGDEVVTAEIALEKVTEIRRVMPVESHRRPGL